MKTECLNLCAWVLKVTAVDKDLGDNGDLDYSLYEGHGIPALNYFKID